MCNIALKLAFASYQLRQGDNTYSWQAFSPCIIQFNSHAENPNKCYLKPYMTKYYLVFSHIRFLNSINLNTL